MKVTGVYYAEREDIDITCWFHRCLQFIITYSLMDLMSSGNIQSPYTTKIRFSGTKHFTEDFPSYFVLFHFSFNENNVLVLRTAIL